VDRVSIEANRLVKRYSDRIVVSEVSFSVSQGEVIGLLGPNGAGKTTTFRMVVGLTVPDKGKVFFNGEEITDLPMYIRAREGIGYLPQESSIFRGLTVEENLLLILESLGVNSGKRERLVKKLLYELGVSHLSRSRGYTLSGGERRRVELARALVTSPQFVLFDEPFTGIDPKTIADIQDIIKQLKEREIGILITDHNVRETLTICDRAYIINEGRIFRSGTPGELEDDKEVRKVYLGDKFRLN
jgi:lipopolysaccharide export system ATP-binding protein